MKNSKINHFTLITLLVFSLIINACKKQDDFLNVKRQLTDVTPTTVEDFQAILDNQSTFNNSFITFGYATADNTYMTDANLDKQNQYVRAAYLYQTDIWQGAVGNTTNDWNGPYATIEATNIVLDGLSKITPDINNQQAYDNVKGSALFYRSYFFYQLALLFSKQYDSSTANSDLGIVLRLTSDVNAASTRATLKQTYDQIIGDLKTAISLLPVTPTYQSRPSQPSANGLLAKVYLAIGDYKNALFYANNSLIQFNTLLDLNNTALVKPTTSTPFPAFPNNPEISFYAYAQGGQGTNFCAATINQGSIDSVLYRSYDANDLRKQCFFVDQGGQNVFFKGTYSAAFWPFNGIAANEILLIRSESSARLGDNINALADLNSLLIKRYKTGTFVPITTTDPTQLLTKILLERRKELPFTNMVRWEDLRRLNKEPRFAVTLKRIYKGNTYTLAPNDQKYVFPIPPIEVQLSGLQQNQR